jgi:F-type H+-transporting ATPase subunit b
MSISELCEQIDDERTLRLSLLDAVADVRAAAADAAVAAATRILGDTVKGQVADELIARDIGEVRQKLN